MQLSQIGVRVIRQAQDRLVARRTTVAACFPSVSEGVALYPSESAGSLPDDQIELCCAPKESSGADAPGRQSGPARTRTPIFGMVVAGCWLVCSALNGQTVPAATTPATTGVQGGAPSTSATSANTQGTAQGGEKFYIKQFKVIGARAMKDGQPLLTASEIEKAVYPFMGPYRTNEDIEGARQSLLEAYRAKGFQTIDVTLPEPHRVHGIVYLQVTAKTIGRIRVVGSRYYDLLEIKREIPSLQPGEIPNFSYLSTELQGLNLQPDREIIPSIHPGTVPGTDDVWLKVTDHFPWHGSVEINNRQSVFTKPYRIDVTSSYDNLFQMGHSLSFSYEVAPEDYHQLQLFSATYLARIPNIPWLTFTITGLKLNSNVVPALDTAVLGSGEQLGFRENITLPPSKGFSHFLSLGLDYKSYDQDIEVADTGSITSPITYFPVSFTYTAIWHHEDGSITTLSPDLTFNIRGIGSDSLAFDADRFESNGDFLYVRGDLAHTQELPEGFQLYNHFQGQICQQPLVNNEQLVGGGIDSVRGYLEAEVLGDNGVIGNVEMRTPSLSRWLGTNVNEWRFYAFADGGQLSLNEPLPSQISNFPLASWGLGTRGQIFSHLNGSADLAYPLISSTTTQRGDWRLCFRVWATF